MATGEMRQTEGWVRTPATAGRPRTAELIFRDRTLVGHIMRSGMAAFIATGAAIGAIALSRTDPLPAAFIGLFAALGAAIVWADLGRWPSTALRVRIEGDGLSVRLYIGRVVWISWDQVVGVYYEKDDEHLWSHDLYMLELRDHALSNIGISQVRGRDRMIDLIGERTTLRPVTERPKQRRRLLGLYWE